MAAAVPCAGEADLLQTQGGCSPRPHSPILTQGAVAAQQHGHCRRRLHGGWRLMLGTFRVSRSQTVLRRGERDKALITLLALQYTSRGGLNLRRALGGSAPQRSARDGFSPGGKGPLSCLRLPVEPGHEAQVSSPPKQLCAMAGTELCPRYLAASSTTTPSRRVVGRSGGLSGARSSRRASRETHPGASSVTA